MIEDGSKFASFMLDMKLQIVLQSPIDILQIPHIARKYSTSIKKFETCFKAKIEAVDYDRVLTVNRNTSSDIILV